MGCFGRIFKWRRKEQDEAHDPASQAPYGTRPAQHAPSDSITSGHSGFTDIEKEAYIRDGKETSPGNEGARRGGPISTLPPAAANYKPNVHPQFSAYAGVAARNDRHGDVYSPRQRGGGAASNYSHDNWTGSQVSTQVSSRQSDAKLKDEGGVEDPEQEARRKKAEEIRRKFEEEEQERLDFFQMM